MKPPTTLWPRPTKWTRRILTTGRVSGLVITTFSVLIADRQFRPATNPYQSFGKLFVRELKEKNHHTASMSSVHSWEADLPAFGRGRYPLLFGLFSQLATLDNSTTTNSTTSLQDLMTTTMRDLDVLWVLLATMMVFLMQTGFSFLEAGSLRSSSVVNVLTKVGLFCHLDSFNIFTHLVLIPSCFARFFHRTLWVHVSQP